MQTYLLAWTSLFIEEQEIRYKLTDYRKNKRAI